MKSSCLTDIRGITHCAFSDESNHNIGRYRSIAMVSLPHRNLDLFDEKIHATLEGSSVREFKWKNLNDAKMRFCATKIVDYVIKQVIGGEFRIDVLTWDVEDSRHKIVGRDDNENFRRMYYHLFKNVLKHRWEHPSLWKFFPDEQSSVDWENLKSFIERELQKTRQLPSDSDDELGLKNLVTLDGITEVQSSSCYPTQVCDFFAGIASYSRMNFAKFCEWEFLECGQTRLFQNETSVEFSNRDKERCKVLAYFNKLCKANKLGVSLKSNKGLQTPNPNYPLNFWLYNPQSDLDIAPIK
ncbi:hypothetical protein [Methanoregula sp.]|uniref:hypothetical protein n=1 Tax=Methanoregula sp. TaxID=2052170 RepID=UPI00356493E5